jgi:hypothetical protein
MKYNGTPYHAFKFKHVVLEVFEESTELRKLGNDEAVGRVGACAEEGNDVLVRDGGKQLRLEFIKK